MAGKNSKEVAKPERLRARSPFKDFEDMERLWFDKCLKEPFPLPAPPWWRGLRFADQKEITLPVDIFDEGGNVVIKAELPGIKKEEIDTSFVGNIITISAEKKHEEKVEKKNYYRFERSYGSFTRSFRLPIEVQAEKGTAKFQNGVLEIRIPKTEEAKKKEKKIPID